MPIEFKALSETEAQNIFGRKARGEEDVEDYVDILQGQKIAVGKSFSLKTQLVVPDEGDSYTILHGSVDEDDPSGVTVRAAKRRFNLAAKQLGYKLNWRENEGWLSGRAVAGEVETSNGTGK